jgi:hypothetical protein
MEVHAAHSADAAADEISAQSAGTYQPEIIQSQKNEQGGNLSPEKLKEQAAALDVPYDKSIEFLKEDVPGYGGHDEEKAQVALLTQLQLKASNHDEVAKNYSPEEVAQYNAQLKTAGMEGDGQTVRDLITQHGGDVSKMSNDMLADLYKPNTHNFNHGLIANETSASGINYFTASHSFERNYAAQTGYTETDPSHGLGSVNPGDGTPENTLAYYDDTGAGLQKASNGEQTMKAIVDEVAQSHAKFLSLV